MALLLGIGVYVEIRPEPTTTHWFAAADIAAGSTLTESLFERRPVPRSLLAPVDIEGRAAHDLKRGDPLTPSGVDHSGFEVPPGWWALGVPLPSPAQPGMPIRLVVRPTGIDGEPRVVPGIVIDAPDDMSDPLGFGSDAGLVAVPEAEAAATAVAVTDRRVTVLLTP